LRNAILDQHVVADLPTDAVAVVVFRVNAADNNAAAILEKNAAGVVAVEQVIVSLVAVEGEVLDDQIGNVLPTEDWKERGYRGVAELPKILPQRAIELEAIALPRDERAFGDGLCPGVRVLRLQAATVAHL